MLRSMGSQRTGHDLVTEQPQQFSGGRSPHLFIQFYLLSPSFPLFLGTYQSQLIFESPCLLTTVSVSSESSVSSSIVFLLVFHHLSYFSVCLVIFYQILYIVHKITASLDHYVFLQGVYLLRQLEDNRARELGAQRAGLQNLDPGEWSGGSCASWANVGGQGYFLVLCTLQIPFSGISVSLFFS